jgi:hypothetical protein
MDKMYALDEPVANKSKKKKRKGGGEPVGLYIVGALGVIVFMLMCADGRQVGGLRPF